MIQKKLLSLGMAAFVSATPLFAGMASPERELSIFPAKPGSEPEITCQGEQKAVASIRDGILTIRRTEFTQQPGIRWNFQFKPQLDLAEFPEAAPLKIRLRGGESGQEYQLESHWYLTDPRGSMGRMVTFKGGPEWQTLEFPVPRRPSGSKARMLAFRLNRIADFDVAEVRLGEARKLSVEFANEPEKAATELRLQGRVSGGDSEVTIKLRDASGKKTARKVPVKDGRFEYAWKNPPLSIQKYNFVTVSGAKSGESLPLAVFGYRPDCDFAWLKVKGPQIVTADGKEFLPAGIGYCRDVIISNQDDAVMEYAKARGLNTIRLPFYTRYFNNNVNEPIDLDAHIRDFIDPVVQAAKRHDMYVILDDHGYFSEKIDEAKARSKQAVSLWDEAGVTEWTNRWRKVAERYKNEPHVLGYELMNEPHDIRPELAREWYMRAIREIRKVDTRHIILVGSADWSHSRSLEQTWGPVASTADAPYNNLVFAFHDYPLDNHPWIVQKHIVKFRDTHQVPVMCTEFGATHWDKGETVCREFQAGMLTLCARERVGWMIWALGKLTDQPRNPYNEVDKVGFGPPRSMDSCAYSDQWIPAARITASPFPQP